MIPITAYITSTCDFCTEGLRPPLCRTQHPVCTPIHAMSEIHFETTTEYEERVIKIPVKHTEVLLDDTVIKKVTVTGNTVEICCSAMGETSGHNWTLLFSKQQIEQIQSQVLKPEQIRAMHARKAQEEEQAQQAKITRLPRADAPSVNWKEKPATKKRLDSTQIESLIHKVFKWPAQYRHHQKIGKAYPSLQKYMHEVLPKQFGISEATAKAIYSARTRTDITVQYEWQWKQFISQLCQFKLERSLPRYLQDRWGTRG